MAGPLAGIGQQQVPLSTPFQPGGGNGADQQVRQGGDQAPAPQTNDVRPQGAPTNQTQQSNEDPGNQRFASAEVSSDDSGNQRRGSVIDIQV
ncbi:MAG: hypothetical protein CMH27_10025 [Micavibrio sp.]|mgnify:CR=1 FL=1|nr:hypothetical protein [Micavibrio sp.]|tara:strand:- start:1454 stop:1729 length:276 start_codon:yes stop_codon:yes gene_type:complete